MVGTAPVIIGQKVPVSYNGSAMENYLEVSIDVSRGGSVANSIATSCLGKADAITVDLGFVLEGSETSIPSNIVNVSTDESSVMRSASELPEVMLGAFRLHHLDIKNNGGLTENEWINMITRRSI